MSAPEPPHIPFPPAPVREPLVVRNGRVTIAEDIPWTKWFKHQEDTFNRLTFGCCPDADRWLPVHTNLVNVTATTPRMSQYSLIKSKFVTFSGEFDVTPTVAGTLASFEMSVPVASTFAATWEAGGRAGDDAGEGARISANISNGTLTVSWTPTDTATRTMNFSGSYWITAGPLPAITVACPTSIPVIGEPYFTALVRSGGTAPYTWTFGLGSGPLPTGLVLNGIMGTISGTPTADGTFPYKLHVEDSSVPPRTADIDCEFVIAPEGFSAIGTITIDHTQCGSSGDTAFWPFCFNSTDDAFKLVADGGYITSPDAFDVVFFSDVDLTAPLDFEVERWDSATGEFIAWVKIPSLSISVDTVIYVGIGNPDITTSQENIPGTWDDGGADYYSAVWHLKNGTVLSLVDSTPNANDGVNTGLTAGAGLVDGAAHNAGVVGASMADSASLQMLKTTLMTWEISWKSANTAPTHYIMLKTDLATTPGWVIRVEPAIGSNAPRLYLYGNHAGDFIYNAGEGLGGSPGICDGAWGVLQITYDGSAVDTGIRMIWRGTPMTMTNPGGSLVNDPVSNSPLLFGYVDQAFMDEVRISKGIVRSDDYATANWNNQISPATFYSLVIMPL